MMDFAFLYNNLSLIYHGYVTCKQVERPEQTSGTLMANKLFVSMPTLWAIYARSEGRSPGNQDVVMYEYNIRGVQS